MIAELFEHRVHGFILPLRLRLLERLIETIRVAWDCAVCGVGVGRNARDAIDSFNSVPLIRVQFGLGKFSNYRVQTALLLPAKIFRGFQTCLQTVELGPVAFQKALFALDLSAEQV